MSWPNFTECKTLEEIYQKLVQRTDANQVHAVMATAFAQHLLQKELLLEQNTYQEKQLLKMEKQNKHTLSLVKATWAMVILTILTNAILVTANISKDIKDALRNNRQEARLE